MTSMEKVNGLESTDNCSYKKNFKAIAGSTAASMALSATSLPILNKAQKYSQKLTKDEVNLVNSAADKVLTECTNLSEKGVKIYDIKNVEKSTNLPKKIELLFNQILQVSEGQNAFFSIKTALGGDGKSILINRDKLSLSTFHEMGHAFNYHNTSIFRAIQKTRMPLTLIIAPMISLLPAFTKKAEAKDGEELTSGQKFKNTLRKASPALAFAAMVPTLAEEAKATQRGNAWAKQLLNSKLASKVCKTNALGFLTYAISAVGLSVASIIAMKIKDSK
jgi:hypothetical protein